MPITSTAGLHDGVRLRADHGRWPAGTEGTVVEAFDDGIIVEIADDKGRTLDTLSLAHGEVEVVWRAPTSAPG